MNIYRRALICTFCCLLVLNACDDHNSSSGEIQNSQNESLNSQAMIKVALEALPVTQNAFPKSQNDDSFGMYANTFAFRFVQSIKTEQSFVYSPFSLHTILTALSMGDDDKLKESLLSALELPNDGDLYQNYASYLYHVLSDGANDDARLNHASAIWTDATIELNQSFADNLVKYFHTAGQVVDFVHYKSDVIKIINQWVGLNTNGMIDSLVTDSDVKESPKLVLANALSFDGKWASRFESQKSILFKKDNGESLTLPGMAQAGHHHYYHSDELKYSTIQLDYADKYSMIVILPDETDGLSSLMTQFSAGEFKNMLAKAENKAVDVTIPKFKMNYDMSDAADRLSRMGLSNIFSENANFSLLASESLHIERILHKAVIDVDQEGTRAAAATGLVAASDTGQLDTEINFIADHPFAFALIHNTTKTILFYGQYYGK